MIKTLKKKFVITAMIAVTVLLAVLVGGINILNITLNNKQSDRMMERITIMNEFDRKPRPSGNMPEFSFPFAPISEDNAMAARFFSVTFNKYGEIIRIHTDRISAVTEDEAESIARQIYKKGDKKGLVENFKYTVTESFDKCVTIFFLDYSNTYNSIISMLIISLLTGIICWILMLILVLLLSQKMIMPIAQNIERQKNFVSNAGHEIKTPLAIILSNTEAMELYNGENKWSINIKNQVKRLNGLMENLLTLSKMDEPDIKLPMAKMSLSSIVNENIKNFSESIYAKNIDIVINTDTDINIFADKNSIMNLISILFDNAVKYTDDKGKIVVKLNKEHNFALFTIKNSFTEKPADKPERLFERFYRGDEARTQSKGGYGIGLSAARAIAEANNAIIKAEYSGNNFIEFTVKFDAIL